MCGCPAQEAEALLAEAMQAVRAQQRYEAEAEPDAHDGESHESDAKEGESDSNGEDDMEQDMGTLLLQVLAFSNSVVKTDQGEPSRRERNGWMASDRRERCDPGADLRSL